MCSWYVFISLIYFHTLFLFKIYNLDWCGPCRNIAPKFEEHALKNSDVIFLKVNADEVEEVVSQYKVNALVRRNVSA